MRPTDSIYSLFKQILIAVVFLLGIPGIGHTEAHPIFGLEKQIVNKDSIDYGNELLEIETLLKKHDSYRDCKECSDSAVVCTIEALQIADSCFGINSETYIDIFCDYMLDDVGLHKPTLIDAFFPFVTTALDQKSKHVWKALYEMAFKMKDINEFDKAIDLFERVIASVCPTGYKYASQINLAEIKYHFKEENPVPVLTILINEIEKEESPGKEELNFMLAKVLADYYLDTANYDKLIDIVEFGEKNADYVSSHDVIMLLNKKKEAYLKTNHIKAIECLDRIIELADQTVVKTESDRQWLSMALIQRGDYSFSHILDLSSALEYYLQALYISTDSLAMMDRVSLLALQRLNSIASESDLNDVILDLGELLVDKLTDELLISESREFILSLVRAYIDAEKISNAEELLKKCEGVIEPNTKSAHRALIYHAAIEIKKNHFVDAIHYLDSLMSLEPDRDIKLTGLKHLKNAYAHLADSRIDAISDSINMITKETISEKIKLIAPIQRANWIAVCEESLSSLLSDVENESSIRNALELNLFKKSLLLRTSTSIKRNIIENHSPNYKEQLASIHNDLVKAINRGDSLETIRLRREYDAFEQYAVSEFLGNHSLLEDINVTIDDVLRQFDDSSIAVDFISISENQKKQLGAFVFSKKKIPNYIPLFSYEETLPAYCINEIWSKILPLTKGYKDLYFCADGPINSLPIEFAKINGNKYVDDFIKPHRVFHLSEINSTSNIGDKICFVGVVNHNASAEDIESTWRGNWTDLPNVKTELESLANHVSSNSLIILFNETATEQAFTALDESAISTLHISTHGVFRNESALIEASRQPNSDDYYIAQRTLSANETSLSAIILHSGNKFWKSPYLENNMDDILMASEIEMLHFPNLKLTVLSTCESGLGEIDNEGVWGLQRAFRIAGTKNLICTLTKVDDYWAAQFMDIFYEKAAHGNNIYDSFQSAQQWIRRELPDNPEIWSSFILIE